MNIIIAIRNAPARIPVTTPAFPARCFLKKTTMSADTTAAMIIAKPPDTFCARTGVKKNTQDIMQEISGTGL
jgi:hypothetical protein